MDDWFIDYDIDININNKVLNKMVYSYYMSIAIMADKYKIL